MIFALSKSLPYQSSLSLGIERRQGLALLLLLILLLIVNALFAINRVRSDAHLGHILEELLGHLLERLLG